MGRFSRLPSGWRVLPSRELTCGCPYTASLGRCWCFPSWRSEKHPGLLEMQAQTEVRRPWPRPRWPPRGEAPETHGQRVMTEAPGSPERLWCHRGWEPGGWLPLPHRRGGETLPFSEQPLYPGDFLLRPQGNRVPTPGDPELAVLLATACPAQEEGTQSHPARPGFAPALSTRPPSVGWDPAHRPGAQGTSPLSTPLPSVGRDPAHRPGVRGPCTEHPTPAHGVGTLHTGPLPGAHALSTPSPSVGRVPTHRPGPSTLAQAWGAPGQGPSSHT